MFLAIALLQSPLAMGLDSVLADPRLKGAMVAVTVQSPDGKVLYERNADLRLLPASNEKLFTCSFALHELGADFRPTTLFWKTPKALIVRANGDPTMSLHDLRVLTKQLNPKRKPVWLSEAYKPGYPDGWQLADLPNRYAAPVYALTIDRGGIELWSHDGKLEFKPDRFDIAVDRGSPSGPFKDVFDVFKNRLAVSGEVPNTDQRLDTLGLPHTDYEAARILGDGYHEVDDVPTRKPDFVQVGAPIATTMQTCLQMSDNNLAENFLLMAASRGETLANPYDQAVAKLTKFLTETIGLSPEQTSPADGSGMSRHNMETVGGIAQLLRWTLQQPTAKLWRSMLDHPGSGTLKTRMRGIAFQGKTGTLEGVSALSGFVETHQGLRVVSIIENNFTCKSSVAKGIEDEVIRKIAADTTDGT
jgi:D-alanyl-D-alanine carboxypeptidase/D-alanyl-D-alanine-endopeptidase (penicillin-binding protein 4)